MAKSRKRKKSGNKTTPLSPKKYIMTRSRQLPIYKCYVNDGWEEQGMAVVTVMRLQPSGKYVIGLYLLDTWCMGLKNTNSMMNITADNFYDELFPQFYKGLDPVEINPEFAQNLIHGAIEYAEDMGFQPQKDFNVSQYVLDLADEIEYIDIEFGKDGQPFYFGGPHDDYKKVMATLLRNVGEGNFHYTLPIGDPNMFDEDYD